MYYVTGDVHGGQEMWHEKITPFLKPGDTILETGAEKRPGRIPADGVPSMGTGTRAVQEMVFRAFSSG